MEGEDALEGGHDGLEDALDVVEDERDGEGGDDLEEEHLERVVQVVAGEERDEDAPGEEGVHRADVVEHVLVVHRAADEDDEKVEPPHHLREAHRREVLLDVVVREVAEARHPDVRCDVHEDRDVDLGLRKVVVEHEHDLHPALPLLGLVALQRLDVRVDHLRRRALLPAPPRRVSSAANRIRPLTAQKADLSTYLGPFPARVVRSHR